MVKYIFSIFVICIISCKSESKRDELSNLIGYNKLEISNEDDRCGEWGGDKRVLIIEKIDNNNFLANYIEYNMSKDCLPIDLEEPKVIYSLKNFNLNDFQIKLVLDCFEDLYTMKKNNKNKFVSNFGIVNQFKINKNLILVDFPSKKYRKFEELILDIKNNYH